MITQRGWLVCPFCGQTVTTTESLSFTPLRTQRLESEVREHLLAAHPIKWRLSRKFRRAMKLSATTPG